MQEALHRLPVSYRVIQVRCFPLGMQVAIEFLLGSSGCREEGRLSLNPYFELVTTHFLCKCCIS